MRLIDVLIEKTLSERGYGGTGRLITRLLHTLSDTYPLNGRYVNEDEWESPGSGISHVTAFSLSLNIRHSEFAHDHNVHWGKLYEAKNVTIDWHG